MAGLTINPKQVKRDGIKGANNMIDQIVNFIDAPFPVKKRYGLKTYQRLHTFPINKATLDAYSDKFKQTHDMKIIPVININEKKEYMVYIRELKKKVRK